MLNLIVADRDKKAGLDVHLSLVPGHEGSIKVHAETDVDSKTILVLHSDGTFQRPTAADDVGFHTNQDGRIVETLNPDRPY